MNFGKTIKMFLIDGEPNGRISYELSNWSGKGYKIPRIKAKDCSGRVDFESAAVYFLFGKDEDGKDLVYIGETESILERLFQHKKEKDFWNETIFFINKDENLNKDQLKYLVQRLFKLAIISNRFRIENTIAHSKSTISESDKADMDEFIENIIMLIHTLGHKVFCDKRETVANQKQGIFSTKSGRGADAKGKLTSEGFVVLKLSKAAGTTSEFMPPGVRALWFRLIDQGVMKFKGEFFEFQDDYIFSSPTIAAEIVLGEKTNQFNVWRTIGGMTVQEYETEEDLLVFNTKPRYLF